MTDKQKYEPPEATVGDHAHTLVRVGVGQDISMLSSAPEDWQNYYGPLEEHLAAFRSQHPTNSDAQSLADSLQHEVDVWRKFGSSFGYVFYLGRAD